jgi:hypothetical protein
MVRCSFSFQLHHVTFDLGVADGRCRAERASRSCPPRHSYLEWQPPPSFVAVQAHTVDAELECGGGGSHAHG